MQSSIALWKRKSVGGILEVKKYPETVIGLRDDVFFRAAAQIMKKYGTHSIDVDYRDGGSGIATTKDVSDAVAEGKDPDEIELGEIATKGHLREIREDATIEEALNEMSRDNRWVYHIRIIGKDGKLKTIASLVDFLVHLLRFEKLIEDQNH